MIRTILTACKWGVDPLTNGAQINIFSEKGDQFFHIPFEGDALLDLVGILGQHLTDDQKKEVMRRMLEPPSENGRPDIVQGEVLDPPTFLPE